MIKKLQPYIVTTIVVSSVFLLANAGVAQKVAQKAIKPTGNQAVSDEQQAILAVRAVKPAVVGIVGTGAADNTDTDSGPVIRAQPSVVRGTGFIISPDGLIVSNNHVVGEPNYKYVVTLVDGTQYDAKVIGLDKYDDIALLKIEAGSLPAARLGDSAALETGQTVFAIGNTLGRYQNTVTKGVVSGLGRAVDSADVSAGLQPRMQQMIQTDAAINPGNSGGPLINLAGEVVGMNTMIDTGGSSLGFSIPINAVKDVVNQLQTFGKASRPFLGVSFVTISSQVILPKDVTAKQGAYIRAVAPGSPADKAGLREGDVVTAINREKLHELNELDHVVSKYAAGTQVLLTYVRDGKAFDATAILTEYQ